ncbi:MAG: GNAT family N-acetyltransferase [Chitinophagaceae bacterium]
MKQLDAGKIFETERLVVRHYTKDDGDNFFLLNGDEEIMRYIRPAKTREETDLFLAEIIKKYEEDPSAGRWATEDKQTGAFVGSFALIPIEGSVDKMQLGYALLKQNWGKGYATELTLSGLEYVLTKTALTEIFAVTEIQNTASQKVLLKAGFKMHSSYTEGTKELFQYIFLKQDFRSQNLADMPV